ncbi:uracil-DNA glycosylase [Thiocapsa rosea]|uniref:Type-4 uracil-DNA glycosylase n=1 Tax=Thiocapsa rosea TaxID=69360 RepID=A0A495V228_9GAMM|nr:uracil-DNA glycosylase [Thiocapsa rosea]RKT43491.1 DNA polymerase [Thiocapsa rosea]
MDERRRLGYLSAMGVDVWMPRHVDAGAGAGAVERSDEIALVEPEPERVAPALECVSPSPVPPSVPPVLQTLPVRAADPEVAPGPVASGPIEPDVLEIGLVEHDLPEATSTHDPARMDWDALATAVSGCRACGLCETRTNTVFGVGNRNADLLIIGEAPGADEDRAGEPFVGRAGQLLNRMLAAIGLAREQVYIANVLKCRPPGNRDPRPEEAKQCEAYLLRQIELLGPRAILCVGRVAAQHVLQTDAPLGSLRGRWLAFRTGAIPLRVTYHPAYLLRSPDQKVKAWEDLVEVARGLREGRGAVIGSGNDKDQSD